MKKAIFLLLAISGWGWAEQCQITSPLPMPVSLSGCTYSGFINASGYPLLSSATFVAGTNVTITQSGSSITINSSAGGGGGGSSSLAVGYGTASGYKVQTSSPTGALNYDQTQFLTSLQGSATAFITIAYSTQATSGSYTVSTTTSSVVMANCASACTVTLPSASGLSGKVYWVKVIGVGVVTIATTSSQTIDGSLTVTPNPNQYADLELIADGSNWEIL
jgi:hypothetical protein